MDHSSKQTKHIKARYYFIKDKIEEGEVISNIVPPRRCGAIFLKSQKKPFRKGRMRLTNVPLGYGDNVERDYLCVQRETSDKVRSLNMVFQILPPGIMFLLCRFWHYVLMLVPLCI